MDSIVIKIKCAPQYQFLNQIRDQGLLFDTIRQALDIDYEGLQEITDEEYQAIEKYERQYDNKSRSHKKGIRG